MQRAGAVQRHADDAALLGEGLENRLADPPDGVGDELDALGLVELVGRADQAEVALIDEVFQRNTAFAVQLGHQDHEAQIGLDQALRRPLVPLGR